MNYYDQLIKSNTVINIRKFNVPDNVCKLHCIAHNNMKYKTQINTNIPKITYKSAKKIILYGVRQRVGNERTP